MPDVSLFTRALAAAKALLFSPHGVRDYLTVLAILVITLVIDVVRRRDLRNGYFSAGFRVDVVYYVFYYGGIYHVLLFAPLYRFMQQALRTYAPVLQLDLLSHLHPVGQIAAMIFVSDVLGYWLHRWSHNNGVLWDLHKIHHAQRHLTVMTNYRFHFLDETYRRVLLFIPFQMLGASAEMWLTVNFVMAWLLLLQHSELDWTYGRFGRLVVSPVFHRIHHSTEEMDQQHNFGMLFTFWDDLFGTAERRDVAPARHGLDGEEIPESFVRQQLHPFLGWAGIGRKQRVIATPLAGSVPES